MAQIGCDEGGCSGGFIFKYECEYYSWRGMLVGCRACSVLPFVAQTYFSGIVPVCYDIYFQRLNSETAVILPSSPTTVTGLKTATSLQKWWGLAKRHVFRQWPFLVNSTEGIFLVTKAVKTKRYAYCHSKGMQGQLAQIRVLGNIPAPQGNTRFAVPSSANRWEAIRNDLAFKLEDSEGKGMFTIFIEREACRMFALSDVSLKEAASRVWRYDLWF